ncbi:MAG: AmmeMemoRadiSam system protein B [Phycisphaerales bacterium]|nr:MAG: AmmeMemoRadiSam system protein B [Phycisphaerales bacterium]
MAGSGAAFYNARPGFFIRYSLFDIRYCPFDESTMTTTPRLRPTIEPVRLAAEDGEVTFALRDASRLSDSVLGVSAGALHLLALMDGRRSVREIRADFARQTGLLIEAPVVERLVETLQEALFLEGDAFERHYDALVAAYRAAPARQVRNAEALGLCGDDGEPFESILRDAPAVDLPGRPVGLIAPHLDYARGRPCYAAAYATLRDRPVPDRVVILGTNHFGRSTSAVATAADFVTPLGTTPNDRAFLDRLEEAVGPLRRFEFDHAGEHSVELQVMWLQHVYGADRFRIVPILCPDPCGPTGTAASDGIGVDLRVFASALGRLAAHDQAETLIIAGADLSHVGPQFGDPQRLDAAFLDAVRQRDERAIEAVRRNDAESFRVQVASEANPTRVCSAGCIFALLMALPHAEVHVLGYHQAVDDQGVCGVTCTAAALTA